MPRSPRLGFDRCEKHLLGALAPVLGIDHEIELERGDVVLIGDHDLDRTEEAAVAVAR